MALTQAVSLSVAPAPAQCSVIQSLHNRLEETEEDDPLSLLVLILVERLMVALGYGETSAGP